MPPGQKRPEGAGLRAGFARMAAGVAAACALASCDGGSAPESNRWRDPQDLGSDAVRESGFERMDNCFDRIFDYDFPDTLSRKLPPLERRREEMGGHAERFGRIARRARRGETLEACLGFIEGARFSTGEHAYPNLAKALRESAVFQSDDEKLLAARRAVNALKSSRISHTYELLSFMPHSAAAMLNTGEISEIEDMSAVFLLLVGHAGRLHDAKGVTLDGGPPIEEVCRRIESGMLTRMTREQLDALDRFYAPKVGGFIEYDTDCRSVGESAWIACDTKSDSAKNLCEDIARREETGEMGRFGVIGLDMSCFQTFREDECGSPYSVYTGNAEYCRAVQKRRQDRLARARQE